MDKARSRCHACVARVAACSGLAAMLAVLASVTADTAAAQSATGQSAAPAGEASAGQPTRGAGQSDKSALLSTQAGPPHDSLDWWTNRGRWTFGFQVGYAVQNAIPKNLSHVNLLIAQPDVGLIAWDSPHSRGPVHRFEILSEGMFGNAVHPGGRVTGHTLLFRLDGKPRRRLVPFLDAGAGVLNTTLDTRAPELNGHLQFTPQGGLGVQYFFNPQRALVFEYRYMHMSNADLVPPNLGFNSSMVTLGFRWLRRPARAAALEAQTPPSHRLFHRLFGAP